MFTTLRSRLAGIAVPAVLITGSLSLAQPAAANDYCVGAKRVAFRVVTG